MLMNLLELTLFEKMTLTAGSSVLPKKTNQKKLHVQASLCERAIFNFLYVVPNRTAHNLLM